MKKASLLSVLSILSLLIISCGGETVKKDPNLGAERKKFIQSVEKQAADGLVKLEADIKEAMNWNLKQVRTDMKNKDTAGEAELKLQLVKKIRPAQKLRDEARAYFEEAKKLRTEFEANLDDSDLPEYDAYKTKMKNSLDKISQGSSDLKDAMDEFKKEFKNLK